MRIYEKSLIDTGDNKIYDYRNGNSLGKGAKKL